MGILSPLVGATSWCLLRAEILKLFLEAPPPGVFLRSVGCSKKESWHLAGSREEGCQQPKPILTNKIGLAS